MVTTDIRRFGALLKHYRRAAGLTQEALADRARLSVRGIQDLERGASKAPRPDTVALLASALELSAPERAELDAAARPTPVAPAAPAAAADLIPLIGRGAEVALLERFLANAAGPPVLLLAGEPGIGKTRLLQATATRAVAGGWAVLVGGCQRRGGQAPYAPLLDALARHLHTVRPERLRDTLAGCAWLGRLLPEFAPVLVPSPAGATPPEQERRLMFAAVARLLSNIAGPAGTLLALDDLQWAGPDALDLLSALAHAPPSAPGAALTPLRVVGAYRDTEVGPADSLGLLVADLAQARLLQQRALGPLGREDAVALLNDLLDAGGGGGECAAPATGTADGVLERAGGVPFYLVSYAQALRAGDAGGVPWDVAQGVRQRVALLPEAGRALLGAAAVAGRRAPYALLAATVGRSEDEVLDGLEAACRARLLLEETDGAYAFAHDIVREVVEADLGAARREALHRRVAAALERAAGAAPEVVAHHYTQGGAVEQALPYLERAGDQAWGRRAHGAAEEYYTAALGHLDARGRALDAARVREKLGLVFHQTGRFEATIRVLELAMDAYEASDDREGLVRAAAWAGRVYSDHAASRAGIARLTPLVERMERAGAPPALLATLYEALGVVLSTANEYAEALAGGGGGAPPPATHVLARAEFNRAGLLQLLGRIEESLQVAREALALAGEAGLTLVLRATLRDMALAEALRGSLAAARSLVERAIVAADQRPTQPMLFVLCLRGWIAFLGGDWASAHGEIDRALALSRQADHSFWSSYAPIFHGRLCLARGAWAEAAASIAEALALAERNDDLQARRWAAAVMAELDVLEGRPAEATARLAPLLDRPGLEEWDVTALLPVLAWAHLEQGQVDRAVAALGRAFAHARREGMRLVLVEALRVQALVALRLGDDAAAARALEEGVALAREMPYPYAEMRLLEVEGAWRARRGDDAAAWRDAGAARALLARLRAGLAPTPPAPSPAMLTTTTGGMSLLSAKAADGAPEECGGGERLAKAERQAWVVGRLRAGEALSPRAYAAALGLERRTAIRDLRELEGRGVIAAYGTTTDRRYTLRHERDER